jgi:hypothetical protein
MSHEYTPAPPRLQAARVPGMSGLLPARISADGRTATWNPALTRAALVRLQVRGPDGALTERPCLNSGRARVREGERIEAVLSDE